MRASPELAVLLALAVAAGSSASQSAQSRPAQSRPAQSPPEQSRSEKRAPAADKLDRWVRDACGNHPMKRIQASRRVTLAGAAGLAAVERFIQRKGRQALSADLVDNSWRFDLPRARTLLRELVQDKGFFWRPQAMRALAKKPEPGEAKLFEAGLKDPSWLVRRAALTGWSTLNDDPTPALRAALTDADVRVRVHAAGILAGRGDPSGYPVLLGALDAEAVFFGDDFGRRLRREAFLLLRKQTRKAFGFRATDPPAKRRAAIQSFAAWVRETHGERHARPAPLARPATAPDWQLGYERRSCRDGDLYLRLDRQGRLWRGLFEPVEVATPEDLRTELRRLAAAVEPTKQRVFGDFRCDFERFTGLGPDHTASLRFGPGAEPAVIAELARRWRSLRRG